MIYGLIPFSHSLMAIDPVLLVFVIGVLAGASVVLLARRIPDLVFILRLMAARRRVRDSSGRRYFLG